MIDYAMKGGLALLPEFFFALLATYIIIRHGSLLQSLSRALIFSWLLCGVAQVGASINDMVNADNINYARRYHIVQGLVNTWNMLN